MGEFDEIDHVADRAFHIYGANLNLLFIHAAKAILSADQAQPASSETVERHVQVSAADREMLLVNWLNELLCLQEVHAEAYSDITISELSDTRIRARVRDEAAAGMLSLFVSRAAPAN